MRCNFTSCTSSNSSANLWEGLRLPIVSWINSWWNLGLRDQMLDKVVMTRSRAIDQMVLYNMYIPGEIKPWWEKYSLHWNCKQRNNKLPGFIFKRRAQQSWNLVLVLLLLSLHLLLLAQGVKAHSSGNNKVRLDKVKPTEKWRGGQYLGSEARPLSESASLPRWSPHIIHPTHYRLPRHKLSIHTHHTRSVRYSPIKSQPSFGFLWCTQCAYRLKCTIRAAFYSASKLCTLYTIHRIAETPAPNQSNPIHTVMRKRFTRLQIV